ncbi:nucleotide exchange factor GrpE [Roseiconus nitratireducens]|uniref:Protein GrpE n=1 Tax=Roseiconus nitratireducens TaxID=2605748 RepID=A0A5M6D9W9_9BACT|nr:nucleotide exchange factor GrpE [Roseiconus nitratireducens]KAA5544341.1 nucleotide exchange factor GrpE [Roseiconus nitratireducens]
MSDDARTNPDSAAADPNTDPSLEDVRQAESATDQALDDAPPTRDEEMERLRRSASEAEKRVLQAQAEAENFRKRMRRDFEDQLKFASTDLIIDLLQVRDNLLRALDASGAGEQGASLRDGVAMVVKQLDDTLAKHSVVEIPAEGEAFDPNLHEAISQIPSDLESGRVAHVAVTGFKLHDRVIRPSQVVVSTGPSA